MEHSAFSNTKGGSIIVGVKDNGEITGVHITSESVQKWVNEMKQNTNPQVVPSIEVVKVDSKQLVIITVTEYPIKPVGYKEKYYKRVLNSNHQLSLTEVVNEHLSIINSSWDYSPDPSPHSKLNKDNNSTTELGYFDFKKELLQAFIHSNSKSY